MDVLLSISIFSVYFLGASSKCSIVRQHELKDNTAVGLLRGRSRYTLGLLAGSGPSAGAIGPAEARWIRANMDVWAMNQFFMHHHVVPDYYNLEMRNLTKTMGGGSNAAFWDVFFDQEKRKRYADVIFTCKTVHASAVRAILQKGCTTEHGAATDRPRELITYDVLSRSADVCRDADLHDDRLAMVRRDTGKVHEFCSSSITRVLALMLRLERYSHICLLGVDLQTPHHFYTALPEYQNIRRHLPAFERTALRIARKRFGSVHATGGRHIEVFLERASHYFGVPFVNLSPTSRLAGTALATMPVVEALRHIGSIDTNGRRGIANKGRAGTQLYEFGELLMQQIPRIGLHRSSGFLTYGSACLQCSLSDQQEDFEAAIALAKANHRTLVVHPIKFKALDLCVRSTQAPHDGDGRSGGFADKCTQNGSDASGSVRYLDASIFYSSEYLKKVTKPYGFLWQDQFDSMYPGLQRPGATTLALERSSWLNSHLGNNKQVQVQIIYFKIFICD
jgi:hypothetical protein